MTDLYRDTSRGAYMPDDMPSLNDEQQVGERIRLIMALRRAGISDTKVLSAMEAVPRHMFVPEQFSDQAYDDVALPIDAHQTISQPSVVAKMTEALEVTDRMTVLEIGTGSGYQAAILSQLVRYVHTVERHENLRDTADLNFSLLGLRNISSHFGDGAKGWSHAAPYDRILVTAAAEYPPAHLMGQLNPEGGVMVIPLGVEGEEQVLVRIEKHDAELHHEELMPVRFVPLVSDE